MEESHATSQTDSQICIVKGRGCGGAGGSRGGGGREGLVRGNITTNRGIRSDVLGHSRSLAHRVVHNVAEDARGGGFLGVLTCSARELELVRVFVFLGVQHVRTL